MTIVGRLLDRFRNPAQAALKDQVAHLLEPDENIAEVFVASKGPKPLVILPGSALLVALSDRRLLVARISTLKPVRLRALVMAEPRQGITEVQMDHRDLVSNLTMKLPSGKGLLFHVFHPYKNAATRTAYQLQLGR